MCDEYSYKQILFSHNVTLNTKSREHATHMQQDCETSFDNTTTIEITH
jgi:hypothetical protein